MTTNAQDGIWHSRQAELSAIGCAILQPSTLEEMRSSVKPEDFRGQRTRQAWEALCCMYEAGTAIDSLLLYERLKAAQDGYPPELIAEAFETVGTTAHAVTYAETVVRFARKRAARLVLVDALKALEATIPDACSEVVSRARVDLGEVYADQIQGRGLISASEALHDVLQTVEDALKNRTSVGLKSGLEALDSASLGLLKKTLIVVGARPSMGKSSLAKRVVLENALQGKRVAVFPVEDGRQRFMLRCLSEIASIPFSTMLDGTLGEEDFERTFMAAEELAKSGLWCADAVRTTPSSIRAELHTYARGGPIDLVVVDYLQRLTPDRRYQNSKHREIGEITGEMKEIAKEFDCPVILLSQLNRSLESRQNKRPQLADLRESGSIEEDADKVWLLYRDERYNETTPEKGIAEIIVAKDRDGEVGTVKVGFQGVYTRFHSLSKSGGPDKW